MKNQGESLDVRLVPVVETLGSHNTNQGTVRDPYIKNCIVDVEDSIEGKILRAIKRYGLSSYNSFGTGTGRGIYSWGGYLWTVIGSTLYRDTSSAGSLTGSGGTARCFFTETQGGTPYLIIKDGDKMFYVTQAGTITAVSDGDYPTSLTDGVANLDGYLFVAKDTLASTGGTVFQSTGANAPSAWDTSSVTTPSKYPDSNTGIARYLNYVMVTGTYSTEFFYDAGNATGAVISPVEGANINWGCPKGATIKTVDGMLIMVAQNQNGQKKVLRFKGLDWEPISTPQVERLLELEVDMSDCYAYLISSQGHSLYCINLITGNRTLVWDNTSQLWYEFTSYDGSSETYFKVVDSAHHNGLMYLLHPSNGKVYTYAYGTYQDDGNTIKVKIRKSNVNLGTTRIKFHRALGLMGDKVNTSVGISYSDDDENTWSTSRTISMNYVPNTTKKWGAFSRRSFELTHEDNTFFAATFYSLEYQVGNNDRGIGA